MASGSAGSAGAGGSTGEAGSAGEAGLAGEPDSPFGSDGKSLRCQTNADCESAGLGKCGEWLPGESVCSCYSAEDNLSAHDKCAHYPNKPPVFTGIFEVTAFVCAKLNDNVQRPAGLLCINEGADAEDKTRDVMCCGKK